MKKTFLFLALAFSSAIMFAQIPTGYYNTANGLTGAMLKTRLSAIITSGHQVNSYDALYNAYPSTDTDKFFEDDRTVLDMYSERPLAADPYNYTHGVKKCGNYSVEGDCYNREHVIPQSLFNEASPMVSDLMFIRPTDGKVNGLRSNYPFGEVTNPTSSGTTLNGSKLGPNTTQGYGGTVFEPIDEFKGDIARMFFYFVTRYESRLSSFETGNMLGGSAFPGLQNWELATLLTWHNEDPVSIQEIDRNNNSYTFQNNRNPFIDRPEFVDLIWGASATDNTPPSAPTALSVGAVSYNSVALTWNASTDDVKLFNYDVYVNGVLNKTVTKTNTVIYGLTPSTPYSFYIVAKDMRSNNSAPSNIASATTLAETTTTGSACGFENFDNFTLNTTTSNYATRTWTNNSVNWNATNARVDLKINDDNAITLKNGVLTSSTLPNGISSLTVTTQSNFGNTSGNYVLKINGVSKGNIPYSNTPTTTTITGIDVLGSFTISLSEANTASTNRVSFDNLSWTCFDGAAAVSDTSGKQNLTVYPNPVRNNEFYISGLGNNEAVQVYGINGQFIKTLSNVKDKQKISIKLPKGVYILKTKDQSTKLIVE